MSGCGFIYDFTVQGRSYFCCTCLPLVECSEERGKNYENIRPTHGKMINKSLND